MWLIRGLVLAMLFVSPLRAEQIAGASAQMLQDARAAWLSGDDETSLPMFATLAAEGNVAARLFLARIEHMDRGTSPWRRALSQDAHKDIFRVPSEWSDIRRSWLSAEVAAGNTLAEMLFKSRSATPDPELIYQLAMLGEAQATDHPTRIIALYGNDSQREALNKQDYLLEELRPYIAYNLGVPEPRGDGLAALRHITGATVTAESPDALPMAGLLALGWGYGDLSADNAYHGAVADWLLSAPATQPIAEICQQCGEGAGQCAMVMMALSGGYYEVIRLDSPLESIVPQDEFLASPRARLMSLRRAAMTRAETDAVLAELPEIQRYSACAADMIAAARAEY